jgi:hypothetical protein
MDATDSRVMGLEAGPNGLGIGLMRHDRVEINPALASNLVVSVKVNRVGITVKNFDSNSSTSTIKPQNAVSERK